MDRPANRIGPPRTIPAALSRFAHSDLPALRCGGEELSYRELLRDAERIARALLARGVRPGDRVALTMGRGADYVRVLLGVIYAGAVQVTLHARWPERQREQVYADCAPVLRVDDAMAQALRCAPLSREEMERPLPALSGEDPFQIVYTSGSTGQPKGVVNCHLLPVRVLLARRDTLLGDIAEGFRCLLMDADLAFQLTLVQLFLALFNGKTAVMATQEELQTPGRLADCIRRNGVDALFGVLSRLVRYLPDPAFAGAVRNLRMILLIGERPAPKLLEELRGASGAHLYDIYGSSEAFCVFGSLEGPEGAAAFEVLSDDPLWILNPDGDREALPGERGELCLGGLAGRMGRYWNDPALTARKYRVHPAYGRLFHTGDIALREPDGRVRICARMDAMVKLHGQRIETGAIERAMESVPGVRRAAVSLRGAGRVLCGYYEGAAEEGELRRALVASLPCYMVPALLQELPALPLNANGKLDRGALPAPARKAGDYVPPRTEREKLLCRVLAQALRTQAPVGLEDSFFALGGDSICGMDAAALLSEQGYELKVEWLFAAPTVRALAAMLSPRAREDEPLALWSAELSEAQRRLVARTVGLDRVEAVYPVLPGMRHFLQQNDPEWLVSAFLTDSALTQREVRNRLAACVRCHQALRTVIVGQGGKEPLQVVLKDWEIPLFCVDLRRLAEGDGETFSDAQVRYLWSLNRMLRAVPISSHEVLFRCGLVRVSQRRSVLVLACSHILLDGIGYRRIQEEVAGGIPAESDVLACNRYMRRILSPAYQRETRRRWQEALNRPVTALTPSGGTPGAQLRLFVAGGAFAERAQRLCARLRVTPAALTCLALGRAMMALCGREEVGFLCANSGREEAFSFLTGMFAGNSPVFVSKGDSLLSIQEQLVRNANRPEPDLEANGAGDDRPLPEHLVFLSMQSFPHRTEMEELYRGILRARIGGAAPPIDIPREQKMVVVLSEPRPPFQLSMIYDGAWYDRAFIDALGQKMLTALRTITAEAEREESEHGTIH